LLQNDTKVNPIKATLTFYSNSKILLNLKKPNLIGEKCFVWVCVFLFSTTRF